MSDDDPKTPDEPGAKDAPEAEGGSDAPAEDASGDAPEGALASAEEPIDAEFEPAENVFTRLTERAVSMPIALALAAAAAVLGGVFGVVFDGGGSGASQAQIEAAVDARMEAFDDRLANLRRTIAESSDEGGGVAAAALNDIEAEVTAARDEIATLTNRLRVVESARGNGDASAEIAEQLDALAADVAVATARSAEIEALAARLDALAETARAQGRAIDQLTETSTILAGRVTGVRTPSGLASAGAAAALAFANLQDAALSGRPFATEAAEASAYFSESEDMDALVGLAEAGAPTPSELIASFRSAARAARAAERPAGGGFVDRLGQLVASLVTVRRLDAPETDSVGDVVVRAQRRLANNDLAGAADEMARLDDGPGEAAAAWVAEARARLEIEARLEALQRSFAEG